jgi:hypothetical protein
LVLPIIAYTLSSTKLEIRAKYFLPGSEGVGGRGRRWWKREGEGGKGGEMTQTLYAQMNKRNFKKCYINIITHKKNIFHPRLVEPSKMEPVAMEALL